VPEPAALVAKARTLALDLTRAMAMIPDRLPPIPLFSRLPRDAFARVLAALQLVRKRAGDVVIAQGAEGTSFFVLVRGTMTVTHQPTEGEPRQLATLGDGAICGEMALVSAQPRSATVTAVTDCDLLEFDRAALASAARESDTIGTALREFTQSRLLHNLMATCPLFQPLDHGQRLELARRFTAHDLDAGATIIEEGQPGRGLFALLSGEVDVSKVDGQEKVLLATLRPGDVFGEISLINDGPTTATVTAATRSTVLFLARDYFQRLVAAVDEVREYVEGLTEERLMDTRIMLAEAPGDIIDLSDDDLLPL
jgi:cAMP-dependent protein kinase regulator